MVTEGRDEVRVIENRGTSIEVKVNTVCDPFGILLMHRLGTMEV